MWKKALYTDLLMKVNITLVELYKRRNIMLFTSKQPISGVCWIPIQKKTQYSLLPCLFSQCTAAFIFLRVLSFFLDWNSTYPCICSVLFCPISYWYTSKVNLFPSEFHVAGRGPYNSGLLRVKHQYLEHIFNVPKCAKFFIYFFLNQ